MHPLPVRLFASACTLADLLYSAHCTACFNNNPLQCTVCELGYIPSNTVPIICQVRTNRSKPEFANCACRLARMARGLFSLTTSFCQASAFPVRSSLRLNVFSFEMMQARPARGVLRPRGCRHSAWVSALVDRLRCDSRNRNRLRFWLQGLQFDWRLVRG